MARMLTERDSTAFILNASRRHVRLLRRYRSDNLIQAIDPLIVGLDAKRQRREELTLDTQSAYDNVIAADADLDDAVRNLFDSAKQHDRANRASPTLPELFPNGGFTSLIDLPQDDEPDEVEALATKLATLGVEHPLFPHAAKLREAAEAVREAIKLHGEAIRTEKSAEAEEDIAKSALRRKYEANYFDARKQWGRPFAERLFPNLRPAKRSAGDAPKLADGEGTEKAA